MPRMLFGEIQNPFACSLSLINHLFPMFLEIALSKGFSGALMTWAGCFSTPFCGREFVLHYWQVQQSWGKNGSMGFGSAVCPISRLFWHNKVELHLQSNAYEKFALQLPSNGSALFSRAVWLVNQREVFEVRMRAMCYPFEMNFI